MLALLERHPGVGRALWGVATQPLHPFPFMIQCLSLTAKTLHALRLGKLNRCIVRACTGPGAGAAREEGLVRAVVHDWFAGLVSDFTAAWRGDPLASLARLGHIQKAVVDRAYASPEGVLERLEQAEKKR